MFCPPFVPIPILTCVLLFVLCLLSEGLPSPDSASQMQPTLQGTTVQLLLQGFPAALLTVDVLSL